MKNPEDFILHSGITYHKIIAKGVADTTSLTADTKKILHGSLPANATWLIGHYSRGSGVAVGQGDLLQTAGEVDPAGNLYVIIQRQQPTIEEKFYWRVYAD